MNDKFEQNSCRRIYLQLIIGTAVVFASPSFGLTQTAQVDYAIAANYYTQESWDEAIDSFGQLILKYPGSEEVCWGKEWVN